jgi:dTDP-glucose 4,6-dehydratase
LHGGGQSVRCFIYIEDVAEATYQIALRGEPGQCYHISTQQQISIRELVERIANMTGIALSELVEISDERLGKDQAYLLDSARLREELGWSDVVNLDTGIAKTCDWVDANLETLLDQPQTYIHKP